MGKLNGFDIYFDNPHSMYYSGTYVEGNVSIDLSAPMKMRGVHIKFKGKAEVSWTEESSSDDSSREYKEKEKYFESDTLLFGNAPSESYAAVELDTGHHDLPFRFMLPQGLPSSFEAPKAKVEYKATAKIVRLDKEDHEVKRFFTVVSVVDLNLKPEYRSPLSGSDQKHLCCCCCRTGPIRAQFHIDRQGWVPGEAIRLYADIYNGSTRTVDKSVVTLVMQLTFHAEGKKRKDTKEMARVTRPSIEAQSQDSWRGELMYIPSLPPTNLGGCKIIDVDYILKLKVDPRGPSLDLEVPLSITIGTIPLCVVQQPPSMGNVPSAPYTNEQPPPSYTEVTTGAAGGGVYAGAYIGAYGDTATAEERAHLTGNRSFTPSYTFYNNWGEETPGPAPPAQGEEKIPL